MLLGSFCSSSKSPCRHHHCKPFATSSPAVFESTAARSRRRCGYPQPARHDGNDEATRFLTASGAQIDPADPVSRNVIARAASNNKRALAEAVLQRFAGRKRIA
jgi:ankyrin repeat protein